MYEFEIWNAWTGTFIDEISAIAKNRKFTWQRNSAETISFDVDLVAFQDRMAKIGEDPYTVLEPYTTDIKIKKDGQYLMAAHVYDRQYSFDNNEVKVSIKADGYLNLFKDRYITKNYTGQSMTAIMWDLINTTQSEINGNFGITLGPNQYTTPSRDRVYERQNIKDALVNAVDNVGSEFDFEFTHDKKFNTYAMIGSDRPDIILSYPDNISSFSIPDTAVALFNRITALGSGFGSEQVSATANDSFSQVKYKLREKPRSYNSVTTQSILQQHADSDLNLSKSIMNLPDVKISGELLDIKDIKIGDRVRFKIKGYPGLVIDGTYRVEKLDVTLSENDAELIGIQFDDHSLSEGA